MTAYLPTVYGDWKPYTAIRVDKRQNQDVDLLERRRLLHRIIQAAVAAVDPETLTRAALAGTSGGPVTVIAIGKASLGMCRGAAQAVRDLRGICVSNIPGPAPDGVEVVIGDHPLPGAASFAAGRKVLRLAEQAKGDLIALVSGGGSALCEQPADGVSPDFIPTVTERLLEHGASIADINLVRRHLSEVKNGGIARRARRPVATFAISDVCGEDPSVIASGPTLYNPVDPDAVFAVLAAHDIEIPATVQEAIYRPLQAVEGSPITVVGDGRTAAHGAMQRARDEGIQASVLDGWLEGDVAGAMSWFLDSAATGVTIAVGEPEVAVTGDGTGGRNTHAALLAAEHLQDTDALFAAFASDGVDGNSSSAGAMVDGTTLRRGGDPRPALGRSDSATYLASTGDLITTGPTGTNVADLWVLWR